MVDSETRSVRNSFSFDDLEAIRSGVGTLDGAGLGAGLTLTRGFSRFMFEVEPWSPSVAAASFAVLALTALTATLVPALRASRPDVVKVLSAE